MSRDSGGSTGAGLWKRASIGRMMGEVRSNRVGPSRKAPRGRMGSEPPGVDSPEGRAGLASEQFREVMGRFAAGVTVVTTIDDDGTPFALTATAFSSLSMDPPMCLVCVDHGAEAHPVIAASRRFAVNFLAEGQSAVSIRFATSGVDKFHAVSWTPGKATGCPILSGVIAWMECDLEAIHAGGDHDIFVGRLRAVGVTEGAPLLYYRGQYGDFAVRPAGDD